MPSESDFYEAIRKVKAKIANANDYHLVQQAATNMGTMGDDARAALNG